MSAFRDTAIGLLEPIAYWGVGEGAGTIASDATTNGNDATYVGVTLGVPGLVPWDPDTAISVDGTDADASYLEPPVGVLDLADSAAEKTILLLVRTTDGSGPLFSLRDSENEEAVIDLHLGNLDATGRPHLTLRADNGSGLTQVGAADPINDGEPHLVVWTRDSSRLNRVLVDGVEVASATDGMTGGVTGDLPAFGRERRWVLFGEADEEHRNAALEIDEIAVCNHIVPDAVIAHLRARIVNPPLLA